MILCSDFELHPPTYKAFMTSLSIITPPVNALALYCVVTKSSKLMGSYKWYLLAYQLASTIYDFVFTLLIQPVVFFPIPMGYPDSMMSKWISLSAHASLIIFISSLPLLTTTILSLFVYRCHLVIPHYHFLKRNNEGHVYICVALLIIYCLPIAAGLVDISPDQDEAKQWVLREYSCAKSVIDAPHLHIYTPTSIRRLVITASALGIFATVVSLYSISLSLFFLAKMNHISQKTKRMQRKYLIYLCIQISIPLFSLLVPVLILMYMFGTSFVLTQSEGNFALGCMGFHGFTSPLSLILCNDAYRKFILTKMRCNFKRKRRNFKMTVSTDRNFPLRTV